MFRVMDATCKFLGLGQGTDPLYICPSLFGTRLPSRFRSHLPSRLRSRPLPFIGYKSGQPVSKQAGQLQNRPAGQLRNRLSCKSGLNIYNVYVCVPVGGHHQWYTFRVVFGERESVCVCVCVCVCDFLPSLLIMHPI